MVQKMAISSPTPSLKGQKTGIGKVIVIFWTINDPPGLHGLIGNIQFKSTKNETGSRSPCMRPRSNPPKMKNSNMVRSRLIILINEEINEANWMISNSVKLDRRIKQHTQFGVSASNGSRDMAWTKSWRKKKIK